MSWKDNLQDAKFRGIAFDIIRAEDTIAHDLVRYAYPNTDGEDIVDQGQAAIEVHCTAVFFGATYETALKSFLSAISERGSAELIHPVYGSMKNMQPGNARVYHDAENVDAAYVDVSFIQSVTSPGFFDSSLPVQKSEATAQKATNALSSGGSLFSSAVSKLSSLSAATKRLNALRDNLNSVISPIVNAVSTVQRTALDYIDYPSSFVSDISSGLSGLMDLRSFDVGTIMSDWSAALDQFSSVVQLPSSAATGKTVTIPGDTATSVSTTDVSSPSDPYIPGSALTTTPNATDVATVTALVQTAVATQLATTASAVLANEIDTPTLTPAQVEQIVGDVRQYIQDAIDTTRTNFTIDQSRPVTESLKDVAQAIETLGEAIVNTLPPLITRQVDAPCNLALLAFQWYGDYTRSDELLRLNPTLRNPNFINRGETLNAFAK